MKQDARDDQNESPTKVSDQVKTGLDSDVLKAANADDSNQRADADTTNQTNIQEKESISATNPVSEGTQVASQKDKND